MPLLLLLEWIDTLGLIPPLPLDEEESGVFGQFSEASRRTVSLEAVTQITGLHRLAIISSLGSWQAVKGMLEMLGTALTLGSEDLQAMSRVVELYLEWLGGLNRPPGVTTESEAAFTTAIIRHLSLVFRVRKGDAKGSVAQLQVGKQAELCRTILKGFLALSGAKPSLAVWKMLMLVTLGVSDSLLRLPLLPPCQLADELAQDLLSTLIEVWLRSASVSGAMWKSLRTYYGRWCHRLAAISQWTAVSLALTQRVSRILYGQGTEAIAFAVQGTAVAIDGLPVQFELFAWRQHLALIGSPADLPPTNCLRAILGIEMLLQVFYAVGQTDDEAAPVERQFPDGNTLLALFGRWLFDAASLRGPEYVECCAHATGILCRLFSKHQFRAPFQPGFLDQFYQTLQQSLGHPSLLVTVFICINCEDLLTARLPGLRVLLPDFVRALRRLVPRPQAPLQLNIRMEDLRRACYKLLGTLLSASIHFPTGPLPVDQPCSAYAEQLAAIFQTPDSLSFAILDCLLASLLAETDAGNQRYLLNLLGAAAIDCTSEHSGLGLLWVQILSELLRRSDNRADPDTAKVALQSLKGSQGAAVPADLISGLVLPALCETVEGLVEAGPSSLLTFAVEVLLDWATHSVPALTLNRDTMARLMKTLERLYALDGSRTGLAQLALDRLLVEIGPRFTDCPLSVSSQLTEFDVYDGETGSLHYFILNEAILACFVERALGTGRELVLVLRTACGRFTWTSRPLYGEEDQPVERPDPSLAGLWKEFQNLAVSETAAPIATLAEVPVFNDAQFSKAIEGDPRRMKNLALLSGLCKEQAKGMEACRVSNSPALVSPPHQVPPFPSQQGTLMRLMLAHFGFLSPASSWILQPLPTSPDLITEIQSIDELPERETMSVSVFYIRSGEQSLEEVLLERRLTHDFLQFVGSLGWAVANGPESVVNLGPDLGRTVPYYCDKNVEVLYHVPALFAHKEEPRVAEVIAGNRVAILWVEDPQDLLSLPAKFACCPSTLIYICVIPMTGAGADGLYRIRILVTATPRDNGSAGSFTFGPLLDGMVLRRERLGDLVRLTCISASLFCAYHLLEGEDDEPPLTPAKTRALQIQAIARKYETVDVHSANIFDAFYSSVLFSRKPTLQQSIHPTQPEEQDDSDIRRPDILMSRSASIGEGLSMSSDSAHAAAMVM